MGPGANPNENLRVRLCDWVTIYENHSDVFDRISSIFSQHWLQVVHYSGQYYKNYNCVVRSILLAR